MDVKYYPNPSQFNPENFSKEARQSRNPYTFLTFGQVNNPGIFISDGGDIGLFITLFPKVLQQSFHTLP